MQSILFQEQQLDLHPEKAIFWREASALLLADLHLGKGAHFRKAGIAVPTAVSDANFRRLRTLINDFAPRRILFLGDLFHSDYNHVWPLFCAFLESYPAISFELIPGNHDILSSRAYDESRLLRQPEILCLGPFALSHHPLTQDQCPPDLYNLHGHIHPGVRLVDRTGSGLKLAAYHFGETAGILPAFGEFTGCVEVPVRRGDRVFVLVEGKVVEVG